MAKLLPTDATFRELRTSSAQAERFVRRVLGIMGEAQKAHGALTARMGTTGTGIAPNYRFENESGRPVFAVDGATHVPWPEGESFDGTENWSSATMTYAEIQSILRALTGYTGPGPKV